MSRGGDGGRGMPRPQLAASMSFVMSRWISLPAQIVRFKGFRRKTGPPEVKREDF